MHSPWWTFVSFFFRLLYHEFAWSYDTVSWLVSMGQWRKWTRTALPYLKGEDVLELAHGPGHLLTAMADGGMFPIGLDLSPQMGKLASQQVTKSGNTVPLTRAQAQKLPFQNETFDSVVTTFPTEFVTAPSTLREIARVLRPRGRVVIVVWAHLEEKTPISRLIQWLYRITGQREPNSDILRAPIEAVGMTYRVTWENVGQSNVMLIIGDDQTE